MKKQVILLITFLIFSISLFAQVPSWESVTSPVNEDLISVCFIDSQNGWILSSGGTLLSTTDGGITWETTDFDSGSFASVYFTDEDHGCIVGWQDSSFILVTTDGGANWSDIDHVKAERLNDVFFSNENTGWAVGLKDNMNYILSSSDGGQTWSEQSYPKVMEGELYSVHFRDDINGTTCGYYGMFLVTNSGGSSWALDVSIPSYGEDINSVFNWDVLKGCAVGTSGIALYTVNLWGTYVETVTNTTEDLNGVSAVPGTNFVWAVGTNGTIIYTSAYYLGWIAQSSGVTENLNAVHMIDALDGWAVGDNGTILHFGFGLSVAEDNEPAFMVYPNPGHGKLFIESKAAKEINELNLFDVTGKRINVKTEIGTTDVIKVDVEGVAPGIYFMKIKTEGKTITNKISLN